MPQNPVLQGLQGADPRIQKGWQQAASTMPDVAAGVDVQPFGAVDQFMTNLMSGPGRITTAVTKPFSGGIRYNPDMMKSGLDPANTFQHELAHARDAQNMTLGQKAMSFFNKMVTPYDQQEDEIAAQQQADMMDRIRKRGDIQLR